MSGPAFLQEEFDFIREGGVKCATPTIVDDVTGGSTIDTECRSALNTLLQELRDIGIITSTP